jgi:hypothetical protein
MPSGAFEAKCFIPPFAYSLMQSQMPLPAMVQRAGVRAARHASQPFALYPNRAIWAFRQHGAFPQDAGVAGDGCGEDRLQGQPKEADGDALARKTPTWHFAVFPNRPQHCIFTPAEFAHIFITVNEKKMTVSI